MARKRGGILLMLFGTVVAIGVAWFVYQQSRQAAATARMESVEVLVAAADIPERTILGAGQLTVKRMLPGSLPSIVLARPDQAVGRMTAAPLLAGDFVLPGKLVGGDGRASLSYHVPPGQVVITLPASDILSTGAVQVGDSIDLLVTVRPPDRAAAAGTTGVKGAADVEIEIGTTQTTMQNLKILAIGNTAPPSSDAAKANGASPPPRPGSSAILTFAVERQDALILKALKDNERVKIEMVLRAAGDAAAVATDPVTLNTIVERYSFRALATPVASGSAGAKR
ncbi:MAG: Flp pilus assembly protein CpaB [Chloroflexota bacterium]|nr:MAG: Flp pilus assembly protein CpaB [Chloroflexota bacterium]